MKSGLPFVARAVALYWILSFVSAYWFPESLEDYYQNTSLVWLEIMSFVALVTVWIVAVGRVLRSLFNRDFKKWRLLHWFYLVLLVPSVMSILIATIILDLLGVGHYSPR